MIDVRQRGSNIQVHDRIEGKGLQQDHAEVAATSQPVDRAEMKQRV